MLAPFTRVPGEPGPCRARSSAACAACGQLISLLARALEQALVVRHEPVRKAHDLEAVAIADEPELPVIAHLAPACPGGGLVHGSVGARYPAARGGTESCPHSPWLVVGDLFGVQGFAIVEHPQACI